MTAELSAEELRCLVAIHRAAESLCWPCPDDILDRLEHAGLIEQSPAIRVPLEFVHCVYRPTPRGLDLLARRGLA